MSRPTELTRIADVYCVKATARAILVRVPGLGDDLWVPQSVVDEESEVWMEGQEGELVVPGWWARKNGIG